MAKGGNSLIMEKISSINFAEGATASIKLPRISNVTDARLALQEFLTHWERDRSAAEKPPR